MGYHGLVAPQTHFINRPTGRSEPRVHPPLLIHSHYTKHSLKHGAIFLIPFWEILLTTQRRCQFLTRITVYLSNYNIQIKLFVKIIFNTNTNYLCIQIFRYVSYCIHIYLGCSYVACALKI